MILLFWLTVALAAEQGWTIAERPGWVVEQDIPEHATQRRERTDVQFLLDDEQIDVGEGGQTHYYRDVLRIGSVAGIQDYSEIAFEFDPSYESLILHHVELVRDGQTIDALRPDELKVVQQERDMDLRLYKGELQVLAFLNDVRVGDVIDRAWSVTGANPALGGHYLDFLDMGHEYPIGRLHRRLRWPGERELHLKEFAGAPAATVSAADALAIYTWALDGVPARKWDGYAPGWLEQRPWVQITDFDDWSGVVDWALPLYVPGEISEELSEAIAEWESEPTPDARLQAALAFVQDDVRYLGIEMGPRGLIPHGVSETFGRRFGDCKDKSLLLVTALNAMGIEAHPALVHTRRQRGTRDLLPTAYAFNHAIVRARIGDEVLWLDATRSYERGAASQMESPGFEAALVIEPGGSALSEMADALLREPQVERVELFSMDELYGPVALTVTTTYRGRHASAVRRQFESEAMEDIRGSRMGSYAERFPGIESTARLAVTDDPVAGQFAVAERYLIGGGMWSDGSVTLVGSEARNWLVDPPPGDRARPLELAHPVYRRHRIEMQLPTDFALTGALDSVKTDNFEVVVDRTYDDRVLVFDVSYRSLRDHVPADEIGEHREDVEKAAGLAVFWFFDAQAGGGTDRATKAAFAGIALVLFLFLVGPTRRALSSWRRRRAFSSRLRNSGADTPETAVLVEDTVQANQALKRMKCDACGAPLNQGVPKSSNIRHDGVHLLLLEAGCSKCDRHTTRYFRFRR